MTKIEVEIPDEAVNAAIDAINDDPEISDYDLGDIVMNQTGIPLRENFGDALREAVIPLMR